MWQIIWLSIFCIIETNYGFCINKGCTFNGTTYRPYSEVQFGCFVFQCTNGEDKDSTESSESWQFLHIDGKCPHCDICNDPHFKTFDGHNYDFQKLCNYTISQPIGCCDVFSSYLPPYGIFGDFQECEFGSPDPTCLDLTTYKISDDLSIQIKHTPTPSLEINGVSVTPSSVPTSYYGCSSLSSAIIWLDGDCIYIVGAYYTIHACYECMYIFTVPEHMKKIAGLCGFYSGLGEISDEYRLRDCTEETFGNEIAFGENWKTIDQGEKECRRCPSDLDHFLKKASICDKEKSISICESIIYQAFEKCPSGYTRSDVSRVIEDCVEDCCSTGLENCERWANVGLEYLCKLSELAQLTKGIEREEKDPKLEKS